MSDVISMAEKTNDGTMRSVEDALKDALSMIGEEGAFEKGKKVLILGLDDTNENFHVSFVQGGMTMSQCVALSEVAKTLFLREMGYIE